MNARCLAFAALLASCSPLLGQALPTADRLADAQVGLGYTYGHPDYPPGGASGFTGYATLDLRAHLGGEFDFHQINPSDGHSAHQRSYEIGPRYFWTRGDLVPYVRAMVGRGEFQYPYALTDLTYTLFSGAGGVDIKFGDYLRVRADYEYQHWLNFQPSGLNPQLLTLGVAYHFAGKPRYK